MSNAFEAFNNRRGEVVDALAGLKAHAETVGALTLAQRIGRELVDKLEEDRFHLVVVGEFNHGKTTFVNALLGKDALPVGVTPTTAVIHHVRHADEPCAALVRADDSKTDVDFDKLKEFAVDPASRGGDKEGEQADDDVMYLEVGYPAELLRKRIVLVDTPGVNDLNLQRAEITYKYIPQSDAVLLSSTPVNRSRRASACFCATASSLSRATRSSSWWPRATSGATRRETRRSTT